MQPRFETERRFIVSDASIVHGAASELITQAYLFASDGFAVRVRLVHTEGGDGHKASTQAWLTGKGPRFDHQREEYEVEVTPLWANQVIARCQHVVKKRRYQVLTDQPWDVDVFMEENEGLIIAELEGGDEISRVPLPTWAFKEISFEPSLDNESLAIKPISLWTEEERSALLPPSALG